MYSKWVTRIFLGAVETVTMGTGVVQKAVGDLCDLGGGAGRKGMMVSVVSHSAVDVAGGLDLEERRERWTFYF